MKKLDKENIYRLCRPYGNFEIVVSLLTIGLLLGFSGYEIMRGNGFPVKYIGVLVLLIALGFAFLKAARFNHQNKYDFIMEALKNDCDFFAAKNKDRNVYDLKVSNKEETFSLSKKSLDELSKYVEVSYKNEQEEDCKNERA